MPLSYHLPFICVFQGETVSGTDADEGQEIFVRKKLEVLLSHQTGAKTQNFEKRDENKMIDGRVNVS